MDISSIPALIKDNFGWEIAKYPDFLKKYKWKPKYIFLDPKTKRYIAIDLVFNQNLSKKIYEKEVLPAIEQNKKLSVCILTPSGTEYDLLKRFCKKTGVGLKSCSVGATNTIIPLPFEKVGRIITKKIWKKEGWFPKVILDEVKKLQKVSFKKPLHDFAIKLEKSNSKDKQFSLISKYINRMLQFDSDFIGDSASFMKLSNLENILQLSNIVNKDHVFHSVRVFLVGCIIIDKFYDKFTRYYKDIFPGVKKISVEYTWLLASLFHDVGRLKQSLYLVYIHNPKDENPEFKEKIEEEMSKVWSDAEYQLALGNVVELICHCKLKKNKRQAFTGYAIQDAVEPKISGILMESYNKCRSHGVISCFDLAADLIRKTKALRIKNKTFILYHIYPALVSIALHDWHIWDELKTVKLFPLKLEEFPLAALLIYIDTWDDFKREEKAKISIDSILFASNRCTINITWHNRNDYLDEKAKYESFEHNICSKNLRLEIKISNERKPNESPTS